MWTIMDKKTMQIIDSANNEEELDAKMQQYKKEGRDVAAIKM